MLLSFCLLFVKSQLLLDVSESLVFGDVGIVGLHEDAFGCDNLFQQILGLFPQASTFSDYIFHLVTVLFLIPDDLECFALNLLNIEVAFLLVL